MNTYRPARPKREFQSRQITTRYCPTCEDRPSSPELPVQVEGVVCETCGGNIFDIAIPTLSMSS